MTNDPEVSLPSDEALPITEDEKARVVAVTHALMMCGTDLDVSLAMTPTEIRAVACKAMGSDVTDRSADYIHGMFDALFAEGRRLPRHDPIPMPRPKR
ncbi:hypothetical protein ATE67_10135 [Sphingopyxis sp. H050]|jgi:hypothetical protein|uniref:hypothetical protein n=1 Tax=Sphingopyxis sp. H050 TaxID=1759072 RepID=UPI000735ED75|nr:hypothetical protein [Sphingopyxis sp. H050]KTE20595.1 hypothetical protein ATE67_10135 [Sphingopyxis sp. H050]